MNDTDVTETKKVYWKMNQIKINFKSEFKLKILRGKIY